jgi:hypothetical protein
MFRKCAATLTLLAVTLNAAPLLAAADREARPEAPAVQRALTSPTPVVAASNGIAPPLAGDVDWSLPPLQFGAAPISRGGLLPFLYAGLGGLQAYDAYSTRAGIKKGAAESNPVVGMMGSGAAFWAAKGGAAFASIYMAEQLVKKNRRRQAVMLMLVTNGIMAAVAASNARVLGAQP